MTQTAEHNTQVEVRKGGFGFAETWEPAVIIKRKGRKVLPEYGHGYHLVRFGDGSMSAVCDFRVV